MWHNCSIDVWSFSFCQPIAGRKPLLIQLVSLLWWCELTSICWIFRTNLRRTKILINKVRFTETAEWFTYNAFRAKFVKCTLSGRHKWGKITNVLGRLVVLGRVLPWPHVTCNGTVLNFKGFNIKFNLIGVLALNKKILQSRLYLVWPHFYDFYRKIHR